ncbi:hypothetical protein TRVL_10184 [Trypanosoma vivax]|nr:hypothetical protein TRVL_10184 [Trypanosoma vivax]
MRTKQRKRGEKRKGSDAARRCDAATTRVAYGSLSHSRQSHVTNATAEVCTRRIPPTSWPLAQRDSRACLHAGHRHTLLRCRYAQHQVSESVPCVSSTFQAGNFFSGVCDDFRVADTRLI